MTKTEENSNRLAAIFMLLALALLSVLALVGCAGIKEQFEEAIANLTPEQQQAIEVAAEQAVAGDWEAALKTLGQLGIPLLGSLAFVWWRRGPVNNRKGTLPGSQS